MLLVAQPAETDFLDLAPEVPDLLAQVALAGAASMRNARLSSALGERRTNLSVEQDVPACQRAAGFLHAAALVEGTQIDDREAEFGDEVFDGLFGRGVVAGHEQHTFRVALLGPFLEVNHRDRVERLDYPSTRCLLSNDHAGAATLQIGQLQGIEVDEWVRGIDEYPPLPIG